LQTVSTLFETELKKRIGTEIMRLGEELAIGQAVKDFAEYKHYTGKIAALSQVLEVFCDEVNTKISER
jgi:hypothetical protein